MKTFFVIVSPISIHLLIFPVVTRFDVPHCFLEGEITWLFCHFDPFIIPDWQLGFMDICIYAFLISLQDAGLLDADNIMGKSHSYKSIIQQWQLSLETILIYSNEGNLGDLSTHQLHGMLTVKSLVVLCKSLCYRYCFLAVIHSHSISQCSFIDYSQWCAW